MGTPRRVAAKAGQGGVVAASFLSRRRCSGMILQGVERPRAPGAVRRVVPSFPRLPPCTSPPRVAIEALRWIPAASLSLAAGTARPVVGPCLRQKARPLRGPIKPPAFQPSLFPGSPISSGAPLPAAPVSQGLLNPSGPGTRVPRRQNRQCPRTYVQGIFGGDGN